MLQLFTDTSANLPVALTKHCLLYTSLGSRENILKAKCEIFENLKKDGLAVLNGDDELLNTVSLPVSYTHLT